ncbi:MAG: hypothetical protein AMXMBFR83_25000 [Phycisphaerae bacterium]
MAVTAATPLAAQEISGADVREAMARAVAWLKEARNADGVWRDAYQPGGTTALVTLALLNAGVPSNDPAVARAIEALRVLPDQHVYTTALKIQVLAAADPARYRNEIRASADFLVRAQVNNGMWGYGPPAGRGDYSNSQFALLGLHEAGKAGAVIPAATWRSAERSWLHGQNADGGWGYMPGANSYGSMTSAGIASLYIVGHSLYARKRPSVGPDGWPHCCGQYAESRALLRAWGWMADNFRADQNAGPAARSSWYFYYMYAMERAGILSGQRFIGEHDWYKEGATVLLERQRRDGSWRETDALVDTAFALLFLAKGHKPVLFHKLAWSSDSRWNLTRNDLTHLCSFISDRLGDPPTWEVVGRDDPLERWLAAPILYLNGNEFPAFTPRHVEQLREFVRQGGTILAVASCTGEKFRQGFVNFARTAFPDDELRRLPDDHPVFRMLFAVDGRSFEVQGIDAGCRTSVIFCPHDLACLWEYPNLPQSRAGLELGANLAAYATGLEPLPDRLDAVKKVRGPAGPPGPPPRGALLIAQLVHDGDWRPDPQVLSRLADYLHEKMGVDVVRQSEPLRATDARLADHPIVFMTGHFSFELSAEETAALGRHLASGGFLFAEACCGRKAFDESFRKLMKELFPRSPLKPLPADSPILTGSPGVPLPKVGYKPAVLAEHPGLSAVRLEGIELDGRFAVVYSTYGIGCGVDGHTCYACRGLAGEDALKLAGNVVLYALSY